MSSLRRYRIEKQLTLLEMSIKTGVNAGSLSRIERGEQFPSQRTAQRLADFLNISVGTLIDSLPDKGALYDN